MILGKQRPHNWCVRAGGKEEMIRRFWWPTVCVDLKEAEDWGWRAQSLEMDWKRNEIILSANQFDQFHSSITFHHLPMPSIDYRITAIAHQLSHRTNSIKSFDCISLSFRATNNKIVLFRNHVPSDGTEKSSAGDQMRIHIGSRQVYEGEYTHRDKQIVR